MLTHPTEQRLTTLGLTGMAKALEPRRHELALQTMRFLFAEVVTIDDILNLWAPAATASS